MFINQQAILPLTLPHLLLSAISVVRSNDKFTAAVLFIITMKEQLLSAVETDKITIKHKSREHQGQPDEKRS